MFYKSIESIPLLLEGSGQVEQMVLGEEVDDG